MAADIRYFNGTTLTFASATVGKVRSISWASKAKEIDVTSLDDSETYSAVGKPKNSLSVTVVGPAPTFGVGSTGAIALAWIDTQTVGTITTAGVLSIQKSGSMDGECTTDIEFVRIPATA